MVFYILNGTSLKGTKLVMSVGTEKISMDQLKLDLSQVSTYYTW